MKKLWETIDALTKMVEAAKELRLKN